MLSLEIQGLTEHDFGEILKTHIWQLNQYKEHEMKTALHELNMQDNGLGVGGLQIFVILFPLNFQSRERKL